jgi:hypothetical protein
LNKAGERIMPGCIAEFQQALAKTIPQRKLLQRIAQGIDAKRTVFAQFEGRFTDQRHLVDLSERRRYIELCVRLMGLLREVEEQEPPVADFHLTVRDVNAKGEELPDQSKVLEGENEESSVEATSLESPQ